MELSAEIKKHLQALQELGITEISREIETLAERSLFLPSAEAAEAWAITTTVDIQNPHTLKTKQPDLV